MFLVLFIYRIIQIQKPHGNISPHNPYMYYAKSALFLYIFYHNILFMLDIYLFHVTHSLCTVNIYIYNTKCMNSRIKLWKTSKINNVYSG